MRITALSKSNYYQQKFLPMKGKRQDDTAIRKFNKFMSDNNLMLNVEIVPISELKTSVVKTKLLTYHFYGNKENNYNNQPVPLIVRSRKYILDPVLSIGDSVRETQLNLIKNYQGNTLSIIGKSDYKVPMPIFIK